MPAQAAAVEVGLAGAVTLGFWGSAGFWLHARQDLRPLAAALARRLGAGVRWYAVSLGPDPDGSLQLETSGATYTPDGQEIPLPGTRDRSAMEEAPSDAALAADEALTVLLEMFEGVHREDGWREERVL